MNRKTISNIVLDLLLLGMLTSRFNIQQVGAWAGGTIYILTDGSVDPTDAPITREENNTYVLTGNVDSLDVYGIVVEKDNIVLNGAGYTLRRAGGGGGTRGIFLNERNNITIRNTNIKLFSAGIYLWLASHCNIYGNNLDSNGVGIHIWDASHNEIHENNLEWSNVGICLFFSSNNSIYANDITNSEEGVWSHASSNNTISRNNIIKNTRGIYLTESFNNRYYHNNFINNTYQADSGAASSEFWDNGYPSGGNYWNDYNGTDLFSGPYQNETRSDGIGDTPYIIAHVNNQDKYPLMRPWEQTTTLYVPTRYKTIQEAINAANEADTIFVYSGIYYENVVVNKTVTLVGENRTMTIIDGNSSGKVVRMTANNVRFTNFTVRNSGGYPESGIDVSSKSNNIAHNIVESNYHGISLSGNSTIIGNDVRDNSFGIRVSGSDSLIENNTIRDSPCGVFIVGTSNIIKNNNVSTCTRGIMLVDDEAHDSWVGSNIIKTCWRGVDISNCFRAKVIQNIFANNSCGVYASGTGCRDCLYANNTFLTNDVGIHLKRTYYDTLTGNNFTGNIQSLEIYVSVSWVQYHKSIDTSNTVNSKKMYYLNNQRDLVIDPNSFPDIGYLAIVNSQPPYDPMNVTIRNLTLANMDQGVFLGHVSGVRIENCNIVNNLCGLRISHTMASGNTIYHNNFINNIQQVSGDSWSSVQNIWDDGYISGGNYWSDYEDRYPNATEIDECGLWDTPYVIDENNQDNYPLMNPYIGHNIAVRQLGLTKTAVGEGLGLAIEIDIANIGSFPETFNVIAYYNTTAMTLTDGKNYRIITLANGSSTTITVLWNTTGVAKGNYTISAIADTVPDETDTTDNTLTDGWIMVTMIGDITGPEGVPDGKCNIRDIAMVAMLYGVIYPDPRYNPNCDLTGPTPGLPDGKVNIRDIALVASHYGEIDP